MENNLMENNLLTIYNDTIHKYSGRFQNPFEYYNLQEDFEDLQILWNTNDNYRIYKYTKLLLYRCDKFIEQLLHDINYHRQQAHPLCSRIRNNHEEHTEIMRTIQQAVPDPLEHFKRTYLEQLPLSLDKYFELLLLIEESTTLPYKQIEGEVYGKIERIS